MVAPLTRGYRERVSGKRNAQSETPGAVTPMTTSGVPVPYSLSEILQGTKRNCATGECAPSGMPFPLPGWAGAAGGAGARMPGPVPPGEPLPVGDSSDRSRKPVKPGVGAGGRTASLLAGRTPPPEPLVVSAGSESLGVVPAGLWTGSGDGGVPGGGTAFGGVAPGLGGAGSNGGGVVPGEGLVPAGVPGDTGVPGRSGALLEPELVPGLGGEEGPLAPGAGEPWASGGT